MPSDARGAASGRHWSLRGWCRPLLVFGLLVLLPRVCANSADKPVARDAAWWRERHERQVAAASSGPDLVFLGDSITEGWQLEGRPAWDRHFSAWRAVNCGVDGDLTQFLLWRLEHGLLAGPSPRAFVVLIGTNNLGFDRATGRQRHTAAETLAGVQRVVQVLREKAPASRVLLLGILPRGPAGGIQRGQIAAINTALRQLDDGQRVRMIDVSARFLDEHGEIPRALMPDLLHPNEEGYAVLAAAIAPEIAELLCRR